MRNSTTNSSAAPSLRRSCAPESRGTRATSYDQIVNWYIQDRRVVERDELAFYRKQPSLHDAVHFGALAIRPNGKRHPHQSRRSPATLEAARDRLQQSNLRASQTFHQLYQAIEDAIGGIHDIGPLTIYDTALRIGAFLGLEPEFIYLHRGTRDGARALGLDVRRDFLSVRDLPTPFQRLKPYEIEDCLCIYKHQLAGAAGRPTRRCS
jgi:hypothetical protein